jgi:hypothetical protein
MQLRDGPMRLLTAHCSSIMLVCAAPVLPLLQAAAATPVRWTAKITANKLACTAHPEPGLSYTAHGFATPYTIDPAIAFTVSDPTAVHGAPLVTPLCLKPGQESGAKFDVQVSTVDNRNSLRQPQQLAAG